MKRALVLVEGQTEERFVKDVLGEYFLVYDLDITPTILTTKRVKNGPSFKGGVTSFRKFQNDVRRLLAGAGDALVTTLIDYVGLPSDFPALDTRPAGDPFARVAHVERSIAEAFGRPRAFLPYLSLHEFEALVFSYPEELPTTLNERQRATEFAAIRARYATPEHINKRIGLQNG